MPGTKQAICVRLFIAPSVAVALITLSFTFVGDGLRDALDPRDQL
jgi:oligopeptide transport system permease protein